jgi:hypothetical protein
MAEIKHGTLYGYNRQKCRCRWCRMANNAYMGAYLQTKRGVTPLRVVGPETLTERITIETTGDELADWNEGAEAAGLSRQAYVRRSVNEVRANEKARARMEADERRPLLEALALVEG